MAEETSQQQISTKRLKSFVRHACIIAKKYKDREDARAELDDQIERMRRFSLRKKEMDEELDELNKKINLVLEKEAQLTGIRKAEGDVSNDLMNNVLHNRDNIKQLNRSVNELRGLLQHYIHVKAEREKKIEALENKIKDKSKRKKDVALLKSKLKKLEGLYHKMKKKGLNVSSLQHKIEGLKLKLSVL